MIEYASTWQSAYLPPRPNCPLIEASTPSTRSLVVSIFAVHLCFILTGKMIHDPFPWIQIVEYLGWGQSEGEGGNLFNMAIWHTKIGVVLVGYAFQMKETKFLPRGISKHEGGSAIFLISDFSNNYCRKQIYICWIYGDILRWIYTWGTSLLYIVAVLGLDLFCHRDSWDSIQ